MKQSQEKRQMSIKQSDHQKAETNKLTDKEEEEEPDTPIRWNYFLLFSYLYVLMGIINGIVVTMPYIYEQLPNYDTMALFNASNLPFSLKFLLAPFLQKFSNVSYGKRKTWLIISLLAGGALLILSSFYTQMKYANLFAVLCIILQTWMVCLDIASHSMMIKQLKSPNQASIILCFSQIFGGLIGGLILLKFTSQQFSQSVGLQHPITTPQILILIFGLLLLIPIAVIHFYFQQTKLDSQKKGDKFSFCQIISYYSTFLKPSSRYFRLCIFFLFYLQGFNFFNSLYDYQLVQAGFSRDTSNTIGNIISIPIVISTFFMGYWTKSMGGKTKVLIISFLITIIINLYLLIIFPIDVWIIGSTSLITNLLDNWRFYIAAVMINQFSPHALTGMYITFLASFSNFGKLTSLHTQICGKFGWKLCSFVGMGIQVIFTIFMPQFYGWVKAGNSHVPKQIQEEEPPLEQHQNNQIEYVNS